MLILAKESLHVDVILFWLNIAITEIDVKAKFRLLTSLFSIGVIVGSAVSATGTGSDVLDELVADVVVAAPWIGRAEMRLCIKFSRTEILFTISLLLISPACSIIGDEADGRDDALTWVWRRGGRQDDRLL